MARKRLTQEQHRPICGLLVKIEFLFLSHSRRIVFSSALRWEEEPDTGGIFGCGKPRSARDSHRVVWPAWHVCPQTTPHVATSAHISRRPQPPDIRYPRYRAPSSDNTTPGCRGRCPSPSGRLGASGAPRSRSLAPVGSSILAEGPSRSPHWAAAHSTSSVSIHRVDGVRWALVLVLVASSCPLRKLSKPVQFCTLLEDGFTLKAIEI